MPEQATRRLMAAAVFIVAAIAAVVSFLHIKDLALAHGQAQLAALLLPISVDGTITAASLALLYAARAGLPSPWLGRLMLTLGVAATIAANAVEGASGGLVGILVSAWPAVAFIGGIELLVWTARTARLSAPVGAPQAAPAGAAEPIESTPVPALPRMHPVSRSRTTRSSASRRTVTPAHAERRYADLIAAGELPSQRQIQRDLRVGQGKAKALHSHLKTALAA
jgi:hypothetical protein